MTPNKESDDVLLKHIQECIARIREYTADGRTAFYESTLVQDAVMRNLQNLAESTQCLSETIKEQRAARSLARHRRLSKRADP